MNEQKGKQKALPIPNYQISEYDVKILPLVKYMGDLNDKQLKAVLYLLGFDKNLPAKRELLADGETCGYRSKVTGEVVYQQHYVYSGYERTDKNWLKYGQDNAFKYLCGDGMIEFAGILKGVE